MTRPNDCAFSIRSGSALHQLQHEHLFVRGSRRAPGPSCLGDGQSDPGNGQQRRQHTHEHHHVHSHIGTCHIEHVHLTLAH